jgi:hypothetical protein
LRETEFDQDAGGTPFRNLIHDKLRERVRKPAGQKPISIAAIINSQSIP